MWIIKIADGVIIIFAISAALYTVIFIDGYNKNTVHSRWLNYKYLGISIIVLLGFAVWMYGRISLKWLT